MPACARFDQRLARRGGTLELLHLPAALFAGLARLRAVGYERGWLPCERVDAPVISVGNLSAGGTGKTPFVAMLVRELARRGLRAGILSRGYGAERGAARHENDEARWFARALEGVELVQDPQRVRGARELVARGVDVIVLDDGFQHRRLARDLDLVLVDATRPWGLPAQGDAPAVRACLPRGLLREPPTALARADALVLTRTDQLAEAELARLRAELAALAPGRPILAAVHRARRLVDPAGRALALAELAGRTVDLLSALGNPEAFQRTVEGLGARIGEHRVFPDHHRYVAADLAGLGAGERWLLTSEKDAVKLEGLARAHVLGAELELLEGAAVLEALLDALPRARARIERAALHEGLHG
ncbi:MAG: tetraacyldisaccharide 4'-kinase [Planctomycetes bacterium]|nr:tetraacyldisaccharide 4'-kinase [Planctomycetota bacterium]